MYKIKNFINKALLSMALFLVSCGDSHNLSSPERQPPEPAPPISQINNNPVVSNPNDDQFVLEGNTFSYDVSQENTTFSDQDGDGLNYNITIDPFIDGLTINSPFVTGIPLIVTNTIITVTATDGKGGSASDEFFLDVIQNTTLDIEPALPTTKFNYANPKLPLHFTDPDHSLGNLAADDNTPENNPITDSGATLGRVLFYDRRLSLNNLVSCASCHFQAFAFSDFEQTSPGFLHRGTKRNSMSLVNSAYYKRGKFFWDESAATLEEQVLLPIEDKIEMGSELAQVIEELKITNFYSNLFEDAFGTPEINNQRISFALAQFIRSLKSYRSKYDEGVAINFSNFTSQESQGHRLFSTNAPGDGRTLSCNNCHTKAAQIADTIHNAGLDLDTSVDEGAGNGSFKVPSLRNVAVTTPYMHDGRFFSLQEVIDFYDSDVQAHPSLDDHYKDETGQILKLNMTEEEKMALEAFLNTLTDEQFLTDEKFSNPF